MWAPHQGLPLVGGTQNNQVHHLSNASKRHQSVHSIFHGTMPAFQRNTFLNHSPSTKQPPELSSCKIRINYQTPASHICIQAHVEVPLACLYLELSSPRSSLSKPFSPFVSPFSSCFLEHFCSFLVWGSLLTTWHEGYRKKS